MKTILSTAALLLTFTLTITAQFQATKINPRIISKPIQKYPTPRIDLRPNCPDLAPVEVKATFVRKTSHYCGTVKITAKLKNLGKKNFSSRSGQATFVLYEHIPGRRAKVVRSIPVTSLRAGATGATLTIYRSWCTGNEFPPYYQACIVYDPDIFLDGNPNNDDCVRTNNCKKLLGQDVSKVLRESI